MNASDIALAANIGEIIAAVLVVVSLVYVALQIRQNTHALKVTAAQAYVGNYNTITAQLTDSDFAVLWRNGLQDFENLEPGEQVQFSAIIGQLMRVMESAFLQWKGGALEDQLWEASERALKDTFMTAGFRQWWQFRRMWYCDDFRDLCDGFEIVDGDHPPYPGLTPAQE